MSQFAGRFSKQRDDLHLAYLAIYRPELIAKYKDVPVAKVNRYSQFVTLFNGARTPQIRRGYLKALLESIWSLESLDRPVWPVVRALETWKDSAYGKAALRGSELDLALKKVGVVVADAPDGVILASFMDSGAKSLVVEMAKTRLELGFNDELYRRNQRFLNVLVDNWAGNRYVSIRKKASPFWARS